MYEVHTRKPGSEWQIVSQLIGRLVDRYTDKVAAINLQFPEPLVEEQKPNRRKRKS